MDIENLNANEQKLLNLGKDKDFEETVIKLKDEKLSKEERISKIKNILSKKGIDYTEEDAEFFESIISCVRNKKIKLSSESLKSVSAGDGVSWEELPPDIQQKIIDKNPDAQKKAKIIAGIIIGVSAAGLLVAGFGIGWGVHKTLGKKN